MNPMQTSAVRRNLAAAASEDEERNALLDALSELWPGPQRDTPEATLRWQADCIIRGPRPGWIGVPLLSMPRGLDGRGAWYTVMRGLITATATVRIYGARDEYTEFASGFAYLESCALMLAVLAALDSTKASTA